MPSIVDVAKRAGVSVTTVSRVISNSSHPVSAETRDRVLAAARALDFAPSALARALVNSESRIIGIIVGDASDPYFATIVRAISDAALEAGYLTLICNSDRIPEIELNFVQMLRNYRADGIIFAGGGLDDEDYVSQMLDLLAWFETQRVPVVALGAHFFDAPQVSIDNQQAGQDMTDYLIGLGHRRIGLIAGPSVLTTSGLRAGGYRAALEAHGIEFDDALVIESNFNFEDGEAAADALLALPTPPTAIFATNDIMAIGCITRLRERGVAVPEQISVVGFDDVAAAQYVHPPLTTIRVPMKEMGAAGVTQLLRMKKGEETVEPMHLLTHSLVVRASAAPPGQQAH